MPLTYGEYVHAARVALGTEISPLCKIYLDTNFWLRLRDVRLGRNTDSEWVSMLTRLEGLVATNQAVCPLSAETFREVFLQNDLNTLTTTLRLIDQLSRGVCLLDPDERMHAEAYHFVRKSLKIHLSDLSPLNHTVWTRAAYVLGMIVPTHPGMDETLELELQKAFFDEMWTRSFEDMINVLGERATQWAPRMPDMSAQMTADKLSHVDDYSSFQQLFLIELRGGLDSYHSCFDSIIRQMTALAFGVIPPDQTLTNEACGEKIANIIYNCFERGVVKRDLPTLHVLARLHAGLRWNRTRKYKDNDVADTWHASAAIAFCDFFFTERSLCHLVSDKTIGIASNFPCKTYFDVRVANIALECV